MFGPKWSQHIDKTRMLHDSIFISWISSSVAPTRTAPPEHSLFQGSFYFLHGETDVSLKWVGPPRVEDVLTLVVLLKLNMRMRFLVSLLVVVPAASFAPLAGPSTIKLRPATLRAVPHPARGPTAGFRMLSMQSKPEATEQLAVPLTLLRVAAGVLMVHHG